MSGTLTIGFVGLGNMGSRMAANLSSRLQTAQSSLRAGGPAAHRLFLHDSRPEAVARVLAESSPSSSSSCGSYVTQFRPAAAQSLGALAAECRQGVVLLCLPGHQQVVETVAALAPELQEEALVVDCSTCGPAAAQAAARLLAEGPRAAYLDAPVTGAPARAASGTLTTMVGGGLADLERAKPYLESFSSKVLHVGDTAGSGQLAKAFNNCLYNVSVAAMAEMLPLAKRAGLALDPLLAVVSSGTGQSFGFDQWAEKALQREFEAPRHGYPMGSAFKDFETLQAAAHSSGIPSLTPVFAAACQTYSRALEMGLANEHKGAMIKVWEEELGVTCSRPDDVSTQDPDSASTSG